MISLTYLSTATEPYSDSELRALLHRSRERNDSADVTGMLLYAGGHFVQTIEGPDDVVDATFARIEKDAKHRDVFIALREEVDARTFPDWSMGFESLTTEEADDLPGFNDYLAAKTMSEEDGQRLGRAGVFHRVFRDRMR